jgi:transmembrane sensor
MDMITEIDNALNQLLDSRTEKLSDETRELLRHLFTTKEGELLFNQWLQQQKAEGNLGDIDYDRIYERVKFHVDATPKIQPKVLPLPITRYLQRVAAILFIPLLGFSAFLLLKKEKITTPIAIVAPEKQQLEYISPAGARLRVLLPDSTEVWLNGNSRLSLSQVYGTKDRTVKLSGQGFFKVKHNDHVKFIVKTGSIDVKALGTSFSVLAYPGEKLVEAILISGKLAISKESHSLFVANDEVILKPAQKVTFNKNSEDLNVEDVYAEPYQSWTKGTLIFNDDPMDKVTKTLEHYYNVRIDIQDQQILTYRFSATLENSSIDQIMEYISYSSPISYSIKKNVITVNLKKR